MLENCYVIGIDIQISSERREKSEELREERLMMAVVPVLLVSIGDYMWKFRNINTCRVITQNTAHYIQLFNKCAIGVKRSMFR